MTFPKSRDEEPLKRHDGGWIDVHDHCYQSEFIAALRDPGVTQMAPGVLLPGWTAAGSLASLPLPDVEASLAELDYALDTLAVLARCSGPPGTPAEMNWEKGTKPLRALLRNMGVRFGSRPTPATPAGADMSALRIPDSTPAPGRRC